MSKDKITVLGERYAKARRRVLLMEADLAAAEAAAYLEADEKEPNKSETWKKHYARRKIAPLAHRLAQERAEMEEARTMLAVLGVDVCG